MATHSQILKWKQLYGSISILPVEDVMHYYRGLTINEFQALTELEDKLPDAAKEEMVIHAALLDPLPVDALATFELTGSPMSLANAILEASVFPEEVLQDKAKAAQQWARTSIEESTMYVLALNIAQIFPALPLHALMDMTPDLLLRYAAAVEEVTKQPIITALFTDMPKQQPVNQKMADSFGVDSQTMNDTTNALREQIQEAKNQAGLKPSS
jgi:hypothetical protein